MEKQKRCRQCGDIKPESQFRQYYGGRKGRYTTCLACERINTRHKYLEKKATDNKLTSSDREELSKIIQLFDLLRQRGLKPPGSREELMPIDLDAELQRHRDELDRVKRAVATVSDATALPADLQDWLTRDLDSYTPDELEEVGDKLIQKFRPQLGVDADFKPIYDDQYRDIINQILKRFDDYSDTYDE